VAIDRPLAGRTALMVLHVQPFIVGMVDDAGVLDRIADAIAGARKAGITVMYSNLGFRPGYPEFEQLAADNLLVAGVSDREHEKVARQAGDIVFGATRASAFTGSDLEVMLRLHDINHLVLTGLTTSGTIFATLSEATDKRFTVSVLSDACTDPDPDLHRALLESAKVPPRGARVLTTADWLREVA
jgi:nicotinamidase-related amidase